jgi:hypothetical protein
MAVLASANRLPVTPTGEPPRPAQTRYDWFLLLLLSVSLLTNVVLGLGLLRAARHATGSAQAARPTLAVGAPVSSIEADRVGGGRETLQFSDHSRPTVLYVFTPSCIWCARNLENLRALSRLSSAGAIRLIGLSLDPDVADYVRRERLDFPVYVPSAAAIKALGLGVTPHTMVVAGGQLEHAWRGAYSAAVGREIEARFGLSLPGLIDEATARRTQ